MVRLFALSAIPMGITSLGKATLKIYKANLAMVVTSAVGAVSVVALSCLLPGLGLTGIGVGWLAGQSAACGATVVATLRLRHGARYLRAAPRPRSCLRSSHTHFSLEAQTRRSELAF